MPDRVLAGAAPAWAPGPVLLVGGSFDPVHGAHVSLADEARRLVMQGEGEIVFVPAARSPHKDEAPSASDAQRVDMLGLGCVELDRWSIWTAELDRAAPGQPSYWVDTLREAKCLCANELRFLIGADQALAFHRWREARAILELGRPVVIPRGGISTPDDLHEALEQTGAWDLRELDMWASWFTPTPEIDVSATAIREALADPKRRDAPIEGLDPRVHAYIVRNGLYRGSADD